MSTVNGYFQIGVRPGGTFLHVFPPQENGIAVTTTEVVEYLNFKGIQFDLKEVDAAVKKMQDITIRINGDEIPAEQEMLKLTIDDDGMTARVRFYAPFEGAAVMDTNEIINDLYFRNVRFGIDKNVIDDFVKNRCYCTEYIVAKGIPVEESTDARIEYLFNYDLSQRPAQNEDGSVDYFHLDNISHCHKGDVLAQMIPMTPGKDGTDVRGMVIKPRVPKRVVFQHGRDISVSEDGLKLISEIDGHVTLVNDKVFVSGVLELTNVDTSTGNIDFTGNVEVAGNVVTGFTVKATGNVLVKGVVEGAHIIAGGQIILQRGINGMSRGVLEAGSNILSKYIENATVKAGGYVETDCAIHSTVTAGSHIVVQGKRGFITGGTIRAGEYIEAKTLGSDMGVDTLIEVGIDPALKERFGVLKTEIATIEKDIARLEPVVKAMGLRFGKGEKFTPEQMAQAKQISALLSQRKEQLKNNNKELEVIQAQFGISSAAFIRVTGQAFPGTKLIVCDVQMRIKTPYQFCRFVREGADVVMKPM